MKTNISQKADNPFNQAKNNSTEKRLGSYSVETSTDTIRSRSSSQILDSSILDSLNKNTSESFKFGRKNAKVTYFKPNEDPSKGLFKQSYSSDSPKNNMDPSFYPSLENEQDLPSSSTDDGLRFTYGESSEADDTIPLAGFDSDTDDM